MIGGVIAGGAGVQSDVVAAEINRKTTVGYIGGTGGIVKSRKQAIAIGISEARHEGDKVPKKK